MDVIDLCSSCSEDDDKCDTMPQEPPRTKKQRQATTSIEYPIRIDIDDDNVVQNITTTTATTTTSTTVSTTGNSNNNQVKVDATLYPSKDRFFNPYLCRTNHKDTTKTPTSTTVNTIGQNHITTAITSSSSSSSYNHINTNTAIFPHNNDTAIATPGIIPLILNYITITGSNSNHLNDKTNNTSTTTTTLILSSSTSTTSMLHIQQKDKWSCGYRNLQMLLSVVLPVVPNTNRTLSPLLLPVLPVHPLNQRLPPPQQEPQQQQRYCLPSLHDIQVSLEELWSHGYDQKGAEHYHYRIKNQSKWIGAVEVANYLSYQYHIDTTIIEFILCPESRSLLIPFCIYYFSKQSSKQHLPTCPYNSCSDDNHLHINNNTPTNSITTLNMVCDILQSIEKRATTHHNQLDDIVIPTCTCPTTVPLYLQWNGHSVTIIGIELSTQQLIILDPKCHGSNLRMTLLQQQQQQQQQPHKPSRPRPLPSMLRLSMSNLIHKDCQVVVIAAASTTTTTTPSSSTTTTYPPPLSQYQLEHIRNNNVPSIIAASDVVMNVRRQQQR